MLRLLMILILGLPCNGSGFEELCRKQYCNADAAQKCNTGPVKYGPSMGLSEPSQRVFPFQMEEEDTDPGDKVYHAGTRSTSTLSKSFFTSSHDISQRQKQFCPNNSCSPCACFNFTWGATCKLCVKNASGNCFLFFHPCYEIKS